MANFTFTGYHGTDKKNVQNILKKGFIISKGNSEWLGDGVYFFISGKSKKPEVQAEKWAILSAWDNSSHTNRYNYYSILNANILVDDSSLLDLTNSDGIEILEYLKKKCLEKLKKCKINIIDGYLINFGRNECNLKFDIVKGDLFIKLSKEERLFKLGSRLPNSTVCSIFNLNCISKISEFKTGKI